MAMTAEASQSAMAIAIQPDQGHGNDATDARPMFQSVESGWYYSTSSGCSTQQSVRIPEAIRPYSYASYVARQLGYQMEHQKTQYPITGGYHSLLVSGFTNWADNSLQPDPIQPYDFQAALGGNWNQQPLRRSYPENDHFHSFQQRDLTYQPRQAADSHEHSSETQFHEEDRNDRSMNIRSMLADMAITTSIQDLSIAIGGLLELESGLQIHVSPSCLIQLAQGNMEIFGIDFNLLYFDGSLQPNNNDRPSGIGRPTGIQSTGGSQPDSFQNTKSEQPIPAAVNQYHTVMLTQSTHLPEYCSPSKRPISEPGPSCKPSSPKLNIASGGNMDRSRDSSATSATDSDPMTSPIVELSDLDSDEEPNSSNSQSSNSNDSNSPIEFVCSTCGKQFGRRFGLNMHFRTHSGERPYECPICQKCFAHQSHLTRHGRTHTGERNHVCQICDKRFTENGSVIRHIRRRHPEVDPDTVRQKTRRRKL